MSVKNIVVNHYHNRVREERKSFDILDWGSEEEQFLRFEVFINKLRQQGSAGDFSVLDVGCGLGDLKALLDGHFGGVNYVGTDLTLSVASEARKRNPDLMILCSDSTQELPFDNASFDYAFASGVFNLDMGNNLTILEQSLPRLFAVVRKGMMINFLHQRASAQVDYCYYYDPEDILAIGRQFADVELIDDYLDKDFSIWFY